MQSFTIYVIFALLRFLVAVYLDEIIQRRTDLGTGSSENGSGFGGLMVLELGGAGEVRRKLLYFLEHAEGFDIPALLQLVSTGAALNGRGFWALCCIDSRG